MIGLLEARPDQKPALRQAEEPAFYHPELDVVRFFAFFLTFIGHAPVQYRDPFWRDHPLLLSGYFAIHGVGFMGLCLFFALSAYLLTALLLQEKTRTGAVHFGNFYVRRMLRIWPLYFFFLLAVRPIAGHFIRPEHFSGTYLAAFLLLVGNWQCVLHGFPESFAAPLWSISVEEQFYLGWPWVVEKLKRHIPAIAIGMLIVANVTRVAMLSVQTTELRMWCNTLARLDPFALGALMAYLLHGRNFRLPAQLRWMIFSLGLTMLVVAGRYTEHDGERAVFYYPLEAISCVLLLFSAWLPSGSWTPGHLGKAVVYLGRISYGLYVYHLMYLDLADTLHLGWWTGKVWSMVLTVVTAALSYWLLEEPFLRLKRRFTYVKSRS